MYEIGTIFIERAMSDVEFFVLTDEGDGSFEVMDYWKTGRRWEQYRMKKSTLEERRRSGEIRPIGRATADELDLLDRLKGLGVSDTEFVEDVYGL